MSELFAKSELNRQAALQLHDQLKLYAPSVHCSYYSCIQLMIHILLTVGKKSEDDIDRGTNGPGSHNYLIEEITKLIAKRDISSVHRFNKIRELKAYRKQSDYKNIRVTSNDSDRATSLADQIYQMLKKLFNL